MSQHHMFCRNITLKYCLLQIDIVWITMKAWLFPQVYHHGHDWLWQHRVEFSVWCLKFLHCAIHISLHSSYSYKGFTGMVLVLCWLYFHVFTKEEKLRQCCPNSKYINWYQKIRNATWYPYICFLNFRSVALASDRSLLCIINDKDGSSS